MNLQYDRIAEACRQLGLRAIAEAWTNLAEQHLKEEGTYGDFVEQLLQEELNAKTTRTQNTLLSFAALPSIKTIEAFDFAFSSGVPKD